MPKRNCIQHAEAKFKNRAKAREAAEKKRMADPLYGKPKPNKYVKRNEEFIYFWGKKGKVK